MVASFVLHWDGELDVTSSRHQASDPPLHVLSDRQRYRLAFLSLLAFSHWRYVITFIYLYLSQ